MPVAKFFKKRRSPTEVIHSTERKMAIIEDGHDDKTIKMAIRKVSHNLEDLKIMLYGTSEHEPIQKQQEHMMDTLLSSDLLTDLLELMPRLEFEARKDLAQVYTFALRQRKQQTAEYIKERPQILRTLVDGYENPEIALNCGAILRPIIRIVELNNLLLHNDSLFSRFFDYVQLQKFDVATDAFAIFKAMLTKHKKDCAKFLNGFFNEVFSKFNLLLQSKNYVTKRQSLKLLGELLLTRSNFQVMMKYINCPNNLKIMMQLLRGKTKAIQFEAFHVFKIFVANPKKSRPVVEILVRHKEKLINLLDTFHKEKDDEAFINQKIILLKTLEKLDASAIENAPDAPAS